jgi:hypothetical protein
MSDLSGYRAQVTELGKAAMAAEANQDFEQAFHNYHQAIKIFMHMVKCKLLPLTLPR